MPRYRFANQFDIIRDIQEMQKDIRRLLVKAGIAGGGSFSGPITSMGTMTLSGSPPVIVPGAPAGAVLVSDASGNLTMQDEVIPSSAVPAGALAETCQRVTCSSSTIAMPTGSLIISQITLVQGVPTTTGHWVSGTTGCTTTTHWWYVLLDNTRKVVAVTADQTSTHITASTDNPVNWGTIYTPTYTGIFYLGVMVACSGTAPTSAGNGSAIGTSIQAALPVSGISNTTQTTPPALGTTMSAIGTATQVPYMYAA
jgi:hypothetical protein